MASPEVERPLLNKKVTFGRDVDPENGPQGQPPPQFRQRSRSGSHKSKKGGHSSGEEKDENEERSHRRLPSQVPTYSSSKSRFRPLSLRKRSYSFSEGHSKNISAPSNKRWKEELPPVAKGGKKSKFLLGGNIRDPLNLNSLSDERVSKIVNAVTPESSPLPTPKHRKPGYKIEVLIPPNISDPLNLMNDNDNDDPQLLSPTFSRRKVGEDGKKVRHRKRVRSSKHPDADHGVPDEGKEPDKNKEDKEKKVKEEIKPPPPPPPPIHSWKKPKHRVSKGAEIVSPVVLNKPFHYKKARRPSHKAREPPQKKNLHPKGVKRCFEYGNYNRYYGYRNREGAPDHRLQFFNPDWFAGRDVLDIGCNVGHLTLAVARTFGSRSCLGVDIDDSLIKMAKKNVKHYTSCIMPQQTPTPSRLTPSGATPGRMTPVAPKSDDETLFPMSLPLLYGPIDPTNPTFMPGSVRLSDHSSRDTGPSSTQTGPFPFPHNVKFACANYVLESDDLLDAIQPEYDTIMCLSTTKWIHLNFGDDGIKRAFKRMYAQLRPGGRLILEAQGFQSYKKRKNLTERIKENFSNIQLRPEGFRDYLIHEVNFSVGETIAIPQHSSQGFQRPIQVFTKLPPFSSRSASSCHTTPYYAGSSHNTPYYFPPSPLGMFPPRPGRPCYAPMALTPMYNSGWNEETSYDQPDSSTNPAYSPSGSAVNPSSTPGYSPSGGAGSVTPSATPTGSGPPSISNSPFGGHGSP